MSTKNDGPCLDFESLLRSIDDATTIRMGLGHEEVIQLAHSTASYLVRRGATFTLDGEPFDPGSLSPIHMRRLIESRGLLNELWPVRR